MLKYTCWFAAAAAAADVQKRLLLSCANSVSKLNAGSVKEFVSFWRICNPLK